MRFGLMFFASTENALAGDKYRLVLESARFADAHGFSSVWVPERHFTQLGCLYPNPAVLHAALARETRRVRLQAGSVVAPLHHPLRIAEEWAVVDNLSGGRVGISFASGWNPADFAFFPERYADRRAELFTAIDSVRRLWRGETLTITSGTGEAVAVRTYPTPLQPELPVWVTAASNPETFRAAGEIGAHLLTHMLDQGVAEVAERVALYREARARHGHDPEAGQVTIMLHTFVAADVERVRAEARGPYCEYLKSNLHLLKGLAVSRGRDLDVDALSATDREAFVGFLFERFFSTRALLGTPSTCRPMVQELEAAGVDEIACLLDFGPPVDAILENLVHLEALKDACSDGARGPARPVAASDRRALDMGLAAIRERCRDELPGEAFYARLQDHGVELEGAYRGIERLWRRDGEALGFVRVAEASAAEPFDVHPALFDSCFQVLVAALPAAAGLGHGDGLYLPAGLDVWRVEAPVGERLWSHAGLSAPFSPGGAIVGDVRVLDEQGRLVAEASGLRLQPALRSTLPATGDALAGCGYRLRWEPRSVVPAAEVPAGAGERWVILADCSGVGDALAAALEGQGATCELIPASARNGSLAARIRAAGGGEIVHLWSLDAAAASLEAAQETGVASALDIVQGLAGAPRGRAGRLWLATRGAQAVEDGSPLAVAQAPLWGFGKACAMEHPEIWGGLVDLDPAATAAASAAQLIVAIRSGDREDQVAFRSGQRHVARLVRAELPPPAPLALDPSASYLITGGLWGLTRAVAAGLIRRGARHLSVLGRTPLPPRGERAGRGGELVAAIEELEASGARVEYAAVDVADEVALRSWLEGRVTEGRPPLRGVVHAASVWRVGDGGSLVRPLVQLDREAFAAVMRPKVVGAWLLAQALAEAQLDFFVCFSSGASLLGSAGQANYAAASAFLDGFAHHLRAAGRRAVSINWGAVSGLGFGATAEGLKVHEHWESRGLGRLAPAEVVEALERVLPSALSQTGVLRIDWERLRRSYPDLLSAPFFAAVAGTDLTPASPAGAFLARLQAAPLAQRAHLLSEHVGEQVRQAMGLSASHPIDFRRGLFEMGMDSLMALDLKNRLQASLGQSIPATLTFEHPTLEALNEYLRAQVLGAVPEPSAGPAEAVPAPDAFTRIAALPESEVDRLFAERVLRSGPRDE
jgi:natural product biosynthesis luciferase-like monooxygenase protein